MPLHFLNKPSLVAYVTCGDPDLATTREVILAAIKAGADVNTVRSRTTALWSAAFNGHADVVEALLAAGANVNGDPA